MTSNAKEYAITRSLRKPLVFVNAVQIAIYYSLFLREGEKMPEEEHRWHIIVVVRERRCNSHEKGRRTKAHDLLEGVGWVGTGSWRKRRKRRRKWAGDPRAHGCDGDLLSCIPLSGTTCREGSRMRAPGRKPARGTSSHSVFVRECSCVMLII